MPPSRALVDAYAFTPASRWRRTDGSELVDWADQAIELADAGGWPVPALALARRGYARAIMGDRGGFDDIDRALDVARHGGDESVLSECVSHLGGAAIAYGDLARRRARSRRASPWSASAGCMGTSPIGCATSAT